MELYNYDVHKNNQLERLKTSMVTSFILFCDIVFFCSTKWKIHDKNKEMKCFIWFRRLIINVLYDSFKCLLDVFLTVLLGDVSRTQSKVYGRAFYQR